MAKRAARSSSRSRCAGAGLDTAELVPGTCAPGVLRSHAPMRGSELTVRRITAKVRRCDSDLPVTLCVRLFSLKTHLSPHDQTREAAPLRRAPCDKVPFP